MKSSSLDGSAGYWLFETVWTRNQDLKPLSVPAQEYLEGELLVENRIEGLPVDLGLELLLFVGQQVDLYVGVGRAPHVHGRQLRSLDDPHDELTEEGGGGERKSDQFLEPKPAHLPSYFGMIPFATPHFSFGAAAKRQG